MDINYRILNIDDQKRQEFELMKFSVIAKSFLNDEEKYKQFEKALKIAYIEYQEDWGVNKK